MKRKIKDRHLDIPAEANRDKHINFTALERNEKDPGDVSASGKLADKEPENRKGKEAWRKKDENR